MQINLRAKTPDNWRFKSKLFLVMKLTTFLMIIACLQVSATAFSQKITLSEKNAPIADVLNKIQEQSGYEFFYNSKALANAGNVTVNVKAVTVNEALDQLFKDQPFTYSIENNTIVVSPAQESVKDKIKGFLGLSAGLSGIVIDSLQEPLSGASVSLVGITTFQTTTDNKGRFNFPSVPNGSYTLVITYVGYQKLERKVQENGSDMRLAFIMHAGTDKLDEVLITGYSKTTQRLSTGAISKVSGAQIEMQPVSDPIEALEGRVSGLFITQTAGYAGAVVNVAIRGVTNITALTTNVATPPLYILDGIPFNSAPVQQTSGGSYTPINALSPLNTINPSDIESINVLKDADATAIYGSRGAAGVIVITTKKGKMGDTKFNLDLSDGFGEASHLIPLLGTAQYLDIRRQAFANDGVTPTATNAPDLTLFNQNAYTSFPNLLIGNTSHQSNAAFDLSGGDPYTQFLFGGNLRHESTVFNSGTADNAEQFHLNLQHRSRDNKFGVTVSVSYDVDNNTIPSNYGLYSTNYGLPPNYPLYNSNGSLYFAPGYTNPLAPYNATFNLKSNNMVANAGFHYTILPGLQIEANAGYNYNNVNDVTLTPTTASNPANNFSSTAQLDNDYVKTYIAEPKLSYSVNLGKGKLTALVGGSWQESQYAQPYFLLGIYSNPALATSIGGLSPLLISSSHYSDYRYVSGYSRLEYEWSDEFLVSGNLRRDGSSKFGDNKRFGTFGSGAAAWIFTKDKFVTDKLPWLSFGKIKTSYGVVGNDNNITNYAYESTYSQGQKYGTASTLTATSIANPDLQWEVTKKLDLALDLGFLQDRVLFSIDAYRNRTSHLLGLNTLPSQDGFSSFNGNLPNGAVIQNRGLEMELTTTNIKKKDFSWTTSINFTLPQNKLLSFPDLTSSIYANYYVVGQSVNLFHVYHFTGWQNGVATVQEANPKSPPVAGIAANGKGDQIIDGNADPKFYGGINNTITYKGFQLDFLLQGVSRKAQRGDLTFGSYPGLGYNDPKSILDLPFKYTANQSSLQAQDYNYYTGSDAAIQNASYLRLKNVSLAYNFSPDWIKHIKMSALQVYVHAQNLLTITGYKGLDPETLSNALPTIRMVIAGIKTTF